MIYRRIEENVDSADVSDIMLKIQEVVDNSIQNLEMKSEEEATKKIDLSGLNFELLEKYFLKMKNKNSAVQSLKDMVENKLKKMVERNPMKVNFYEKYQEIILKYNEGKESVKIGEVFKEFLEFLKGLSEEEAETKREGLTEEQKAVFDIVRSDKTLSPSESKLVKKICVELLEELKKEKLNVEQWSVKQTTSASVFKYVYDKLFDELPHPAYQTEDITTKTNLLFEHLKNQYLGRGVSVYGAY